MHFISESERRGSNPRHPAWEADTLPTELRSQVFKNSIVNLNQGNDLFNLSGLRLTGLIQLYLFQIFV